MQSSDYSHFKPHEMIGQLDTLVQSHLNSSKPNKEKTCAFVLPILNRLGKFDASIISREDKEIIKKDCEIIKSLSSKGSKVFELSNQMLTKLSGSTQPQEPSNYDKSPIHQLISDLVEFESVYLEGSESMPNVVALSILPTLYRLIRCDTNKISAEDRKLVLSFCEKFNDQVRGDSEAKKVVNKVIAHFHLLER